MTIYRAVKSCTYEGRHLFPTTIGFPTTYVFSITEKVRLFSDPLVHLCLDPSHAKDDLQGVEGIFSQKKLQGV